MLKVDLHLHSIASDGKLSPEKIVSTAVRLCFNIIAITDHDSVFGIPPALAAAQAFSNLTVIPGVEINTDVTHGEVHILGYFLDYTNPELCSTLGRLRESRQLRGVEMVAKLRSLGLDLDWDRVQELAQGAPIGRPHIAQALLERGYVSSIKDAFVKYIGRDGPAYVERTKVTPVEAVELIVKAGGLPVLAHPAEINKLNELVGELKGAGLVGLEVFYDSYPPNVVTRLLAMAKQYGLITTGGSDFHGLEGESMETLPEITLPRESLESLFTLAGKAHLFSNLFYDL